jgi:trk system potassium uptake protein TrkH
LLILFSATMLPPIAMAWWYDGYPVMSPFLQALGSDAWGWGCSAGRRCAGSRWSYATGTDSFWWWRSGFYRRCWAPCRSCCPITRRCAFVDAVFETVSGLTTTGATILSDLDTMPKAILYYRAQLHFLGGIGIVVLAVALLPMLGIGGMQLYPRPQPLGR